MMKFSEFLKKLTKEQVNIWWDSIAPENAFRILSLLTLTLGGKTRSPKFPNFLEHHKPFPSKNRSNRSAMYVNRNTYKPIVHYMKKSNAKAQIICCQTITFLRREVLTLLPLKIFDFLAP